MGTIDTKRNSRTVTEVAAELEAAVNAYEQAAQEHAAWHRTGSKHRQAIAAASEKAHKLRLELNTLTTISDPWDGLR